MPDHLFFAQSLKATYPYTPDGAPLWTADMHWPEPWALLSAMAAVTQRVRLSTNIYVAPARDLFTVAKGVSTAAAISHDRVALGVGAGWCEDEFVQTGQDFHTRGKRLDEMLEVLPKLLTGDVVEHHGEFYDFDPLSIAPVPTKPVPVIVGGNSPAAMRRAARVADGWIPAASVKPDDFKPVLAEMRRLRAEAGRDHLPFEIIVAFAALPDPDLYRQFEDLGVSGVMAAPWLTKAPGKDRYGYDADHVRTRMERFAEKLIS